MKVSFNGARRNLAYNFNDLVKALELMKPIDELPQEVLSRLNNMRHLIGCFMCMYDEETEGDCDQITDIELCEIETE